MAPTRSALIVANSEFDDSKLKQLLAPAHDADALVKVLEDPAIGAFSVEVLLDAPESVARRKLAAFFRDRSRDDLLLLHLSCHGVKDADAQLYFAMRDTDVDDLEATAIEAAWLRRLLDRSRSRRIVLTLDCCHSGAFASDLLARADTGVQLNENLGGRGRAVITASDALQYAFEGEQVHGEATPSLFTRALADGLASGAADRDRDGRISINELFDHVRESLRELTPNQTPRMWQLDVEGELYIARAPNADAAAAPTAVSRSVEVLAELRRASQSPLTSIREGAVLELAQLLTAGEQDVRDGSRDLLELLIDDDSRRVSEAARAALGEPGADRRRDVAAAEAAGYADDRIAARDRVEDALDVEPPVDWHTVKRTVDVRHDDEIFSVEFSPDGSMLATAGKDMTARLWDMQGRERARMAHDSFTYTAIFSPDGRTVATASHDNTARLWDATSGRELARLAHGDTVWDVVFGPDGEVVATCSDDGTAGLWEAKTGRELARLEHADNWVSNVAISPDGHTLATGCITTVRLWDVLSGRELAQFEHGEGVHCLEFNPDGRSLVVAGDDEIVRLWRWDKASESVSLLAELPHDNYSYNAAFSADGRMIATGGFDHSARLWDAATGRQLALMAHDHDDVYGVRFTPDGRMVATASDDKTARLWETDSGLEATRLEHDSHVRRVAFSPDGRMLATASAATARVWAGGE